jgi:hypothetical protein
MQRDVVLFVYTLTMDEGYTLIFIYLVACLCLFACVVLVKLSAFEMSNLRDDLNYDSSSSFSETSSSYNIPQYKEMRKIEPQKTPAILRSRNIQKINERKERVSLLYCLYIFNNNNDDSFYF